MQMDQQLAIYNITELKRLNLNFLLYDLSYLEGHRKCLETDTVIYIIFCLKFKLNGDISLKC